MPFNRACRLVISTGAEDVTKHFTKYRTQSTIEGLRVSFRIEKTTKITSNTAKITVYNLSKSSRARFSILPAHVHLMAGYEDNLATIYKGDLSDSRSKKNSVNWMTEMLCGTGANVMGGARSSFTVGAGGTHLEQVKRLLSDAGIVMPTDKESMLKFLSGEVTPNGKAVHGASVKQAAKLMKKGGYRLSIQDDQIVVVDENKARFANATVISPDTGLIGSPEMGAPERKGAKPVLSFRSYLKPEMKCGGFVSLFSRDLQGAFQIMKIVMIGDTRSKSWYSEVEAIPL